MFTWCAKRKLAISFLWGKISLLKADIRFTACNDSIEPQSGRYLQVRPLISITLDKKADVLN
ncbi:MAG: hypothetical protein ACJAXJ_003267 [Colwellia sp.]|jgi:hypothetical protein